MTRDKQEQLPDIVSEIKRETEELIRLADRAFLSLCGILWEDDIQHPQ